MAVDEVGRESSSDEKRKAARAWRGERAPISHTKYRVSFSLSMVLGSGRFPCCSLIPSHRSSNIWFSLENLIKTMASNQKYCMETVFVSFFTHIYHFLSCSLVTSSLASNSPHLISRLDVLCSLYEARLNWILGGIQKQKQSIMVCSKAQKYTYVWPFSFAEIEHCKFPISWTAASVYN